MLVFLKEVVIKVGTYQPIWGCCHVGGATPRARMPMGEF